jgi:hypothetical protein
MERGEQQAQGYQHNFCTITYHVTTTSQEIEQTRLLIKILVGLRFQRLEDLQLREKIGSRLKGLSGIRRRVSISELDS